MLLLLISDPFFDIGKALPQARIISEHRPSVVVVEIPPDISSVSVSEISNVRAVIFSADNTTLTTLGDPLAIDALSTGEKLFVHAWSITQISDPKIRRGDGFSWDTPGFEPPDKNR